MSQTKYKLPDDLKKLCISLIRGHERRVRKYYDKRHDILQGGSAPLDGLPKGNSKSDSTANKILQLEDIDASFDAYAIKAVEQAKLSIGIDFLSEELRQNLIVAIWNSCMDGRNFKAEHYNLPMGKDNFYERRRKFLHEIAKNMEFL